MKRIPILRSFFIALTVFFAPTLNCAPRGNMSTFNDKNTRTLRACFYATLVSAIAAGYYHWEIKRIQQLINKCPPKGNSSREKYEKRLSDHTKSRGSWLQVGFVALMYFFIELS